MTRVLSAIFQFVKLPDATTHHPALDPQINEGLDPLCRLPTPKRKNVIPASLILRTVLLLVNQVKRQGERRVQP